MKTMIAALAIGGLMVASPAGAENAHGSIAVGNTAYGESITYGFAWNYATRDDATEAALNACRTSGGTDCAERAWFQNGCGALAVDQYGAGGAKGAMTQDQAEVGAMRTCEASGGSGCSVVGSQCASPGGEPGTWSGSEHVVAASESETGSETPHSGSEPVIVEAPEERQNTVPRLPRCNDLGQLPSVEEECWQEAANQPNCDVHLTQVSTHPHSDPRWGTLEWSGSCRDNVAHGQGTLEFDFEYYSEIDESRGSETRRDTGEFVEGKKQGHWVEEFSGIIGGRTFRFIQEGSYVDGLRHGKWPWQTENGREGADFYRDGEWVGSVDPDASWGETW